MRDVVPVVLVDELLGEVRVVQAQGREDDLVSQGLGDLVELVEARRACVGIKRDCVCSTA